MKYLVFISLFLVYCVGDLCTGFNSCLWKREDALKCYRSANFSYFESEFVDIVTDYSSGGSFYLDWAIYRQALKAGVPNYDIMIDLDSDMSDLITEEFQSWHDSELALNRIFRYARDGHFMIGMNAAFKNMYYFHPVGLSSNWNGSKQVLTMKTQNSASYLDMIQLNYTTWYETHDWESLDGMIITKINDMDPFDYIRELCKGYRFSRDDSTCLNDLIQENSIGSNWHTREPENIGIPEGPIEYELQDPITFDTSQVTLDFLTCMIKNIPESTSPFITCSDYTESELALLTIINYLNTQRRRGGRDVEENDLDLPPTTTLTRDDILEQRGIKKYERLLKHFANHQQELEEEENERRSEPTDTQVLCNSGPFIVYRFDGYGDTAVLYLSSMSIDSAGLNMFLTCVGYLDSIGITKIVMDLRENGGGDLRFGNMIAQGFMKRTMVHPEYMMSPMLMTRRLFQNDWPKEGLTDYFYFPEPGTHKEIEILETDGSTSYYSPFNWYDSPPESMYPEIKVAVDGFTGFEPEDIIMITDGGCGSACGIMLKNIISAKAGRAWYYGGIVGQDADVGSYDGAGAQTKIGLTGGPHKTYRFSWAMYFTPTFDGFFDKTKIDYTKRLAFDIRNGGRRFKVWDGLNPPDDIDTVFSVVMQMNNTCEDWNIKIDPSCGTGPVEHGIYGRPCDGLEFDMDGECVMKRCDVGYYMNEEKTMCTSIDDAPIYSTFKEQQKIVDPPVVDIGVYLKCSLFVTFFFVLDLVLM